MSGRVDARAVGSMDLYSRVLELVVERLDLPAVRYTEKDINKERDPIERATKTIFNDIIERCATTLGKAKIDRLTLSQVLSACEPEEENLDIYGAILDKMEPAIMKISLVTQPAIERLALQFLTKIDPDLAASLDKQMLALPRLTMSELDAFVEKNLEECVSDPTMDNKINSSFLAFKALSRMTEKCKKEDFDDLKIVAKSFIRIINGIDPKVLKLIMDTKIKGMDLKFLETLVDLLDTYLNKAKEKITPDKKISGDVIDACLLASLVGEKATVTETVVTEKENVKEEEDVVAKREIQGRMDLQLAEGKKSFLSIEILGQKEDAFLPFNLKCSTYVEEVAGDVLPKTPEKAINSINRELKRRYT